QHLTHASIPFPYTTLFRSNRINTPEIAEQLLADGTADMVSMARPLLADPFFVVKAQQGQPEKINTCIACNQACLDHVFENKRARDRKSTRLNSSHVKISYA